MVQKIVKRWEDYSRLGDLSPHELRRTTITRALDNGLDLLPEKRCGNNENSPVI
jgi:integrase